MNQNAPYSPSSNYNHNLVDRLQLTAEMGEAAKRLLRIVIVAVTFARELQDEDSLTDAERGELSRSGDLTIVWPRPR